MKAKIDKDKTVIMHEIQVTTGNIFVSIIHVTFERLFLTTLFRILGQQLTR